MISYLVKSYLIVGAGMTALALYQTHKMFGGLGKFLSCPAPARKRVYAAFAVLIGYSFFLWPKRLINRAK